MQDKEMERERVVGGAVVGSSSSTWEAGLVWFACFILLVMMIHK